MTSSSNQSIGAIPEKLYINQKIESLTSLWINRITLLATFMWILFVIPDILHSRELFFKVLPYRISIILFLVAMNILNRFLSKNIHQYILALATVSACTLSVTAIFLIHGDEGTIHLAAYILILLSGLGFIPMNFKRTMIMVFSIYAFYIIPYFFFGKVLETYIFFLVNFYVASAALMLVILRMTLQDNLMNELKLKYRLEGTIDIKSEQVRTSEIIMKNLIENASEGILIVDREGRILDTNKKFFEMHSLNEECSRDTEITKVYDKNNEKVFMDNFKKVLTEKSHTLFELEFNNGDKKAVEVSMAAIKFEKNPVVIAFYRDITERKLSSQRLAQIQKMESIGKLACGVSHDIKNVITTVQGYLDFIKFTNVNGDSEFALKKIQNNANVVEQEIIMAKELISKLLRIGSKSLGDESSLIDINEFINETTSMYEKIFSDIDIRTDYQDGLPKIKGYKINLSQALHNLILNARDAMPQGGTISIKTEFVKDIPTVLNIDEREKADGYILISVSDTGIGVSDENLPHIFEPFYTLKDSCDSSLSGGTGLGLAVVYGIVKEHNGLITVKSKVTEGTTFYIYLPVVLKASEVTT